VYVWDAPTGISLIATGLVLEIVAAQPRFIIL
jgi:hypothetical protein